ncbi:MAG: Leucyl-tRNA synthetase, mitochondrial [Thelocarpon impressellum]|nr:MAG: Leucyl-tRNA synthetase, mitochondrial [Thelocarpon impressellum]
MFPYPSGALHLGHLRVYTISDVLARFKQMRGYRVIQPMGWDAFGLPAENAAIERGVDPKKWTTENIRKMKKQLLQMGGRWDWDREIMTCDPAFYKHTQRLFLMLHEHGLAYQAESLVNYDPVDRTVLANEQVDANGMSWRSGAKVEKIRLKQWFFRITAFRDALLEDLDPLGKDGMWPERVLSMQRNWLGKSTGARVKFPIDCTTDRILDTVVQIFTTRPDTLFGVQYLALSATHPLVDKLAKTSPSLQAFLDTLPSLPPDSKAGYLLQGLHATNPLAFLSPTSLTAEPLPVYVAPYVLGDYGEGAVMGVPGHDARDNAFWKEHRGGDQVHSVVRPSDELDHGDRIHPQPTVLSPSCGPFAGESSSEATKNIVQLLQEGDYAEHAESWRLRDWLVSRQRYWGAPIPMIHCGDCGAVPVPTDQLPVELPELSGDRLRNRVGNPLESVEEWVNVDCPSCGGSARRDTDTMDTFVDSSWYFMRFADPHSKMAPFSAEAANTTLPVDVYVGGVEHAILHLLYARFISKFLSMTSLWSSGGASSGEPFTRLITQGMVHGRTYSDPSTGRFLHPDAVDATTDPSKPILRTTGKPVIISWEKMSKSKHNGVDPAACIERWGADATRAHMLFLAPVSEVLLWEEGPIVAFAEECWERLHPNGTTSIHDAPWPTLHAGKAGPLHTQTPTQNLSVQINGRFRFALSIPSPPKSIQNEGKEAMEAYLTAQALNAPQGETYLRQKHDLEKLKKVFVGKGWKSVNFVF